MVVVDVPRATAESVVREIAHRGYHAEPYYDRPAADDRRGGAGPGRRRLRIHVPDWSPDPPELARRVAGVEAAIVDLDGVEMVAVEKWEAR